MGQMLKGLAHYVKNPGTLQEMGQLLNYERVALSKQMYPFQSQPCKDGEIGPVWPAAEGQGPGTE